jgi:serine/threonine protein kinase
MVCYKDFDILRQLGNGSFGRVFLARYRRNQKLYALKVLNKKKLIAKKQLKYAVG